MEPISATVASASVAPSPLATPDNAMLDKDAFLKLLVAQLRYQDPTAPTDVSQMMSQTSQLSMVERLDQIAVGIERLGGTTPISSAANMLGKQVTFDVGFGPMSANVDAVHLVEGDVIVSAGGYQVPLSAVMSVADVAAPSVPSVPAATPSPTEPPAAGGGDSTDDAGTTAVAGTDPTSTGTDATGTDAADADAADAENAASGAGDEPDDVVATNEVAVQTTDQQNDTAT